MPNTINVPVWCYTRASAKQIMMMELLDPNRSLSGLCYQYEKKSSSNIQMTSDWTGTGKPIFFNHLHSQATRPQNQTESSNFPTEAFTLSVLGKTCEKAHKPYGEVRVKIHFRILKKYNFSKMQVSTWVSQIDELQSSMIKCVSAGRQHVD